MKEYKAARNYELAQVIGSAYRYRKMYPEHAEMLLRSAKNVWSFFNPKLTVLERSQNPNEN